MAIGKKTGGRKPGTVNKITSEIRVLAQKHAPEAVKELARIFKTSESDAARVAAIKEILDRGYGKSAQPLVGQSDAPPISIVVSSADAKL